MRQQQRLVLIISILASMVATIDGFIVNVALPAISRDLGGGLAVQQWTIDAYLLTLGTLILIAGSLSDLFGRKRILAVGLVWFGLTSLLCAVAPNGAFLVIARALQGVGGSLVVPSSLALIISVFSRKEQGRAIGQWTAWLSIATVLGPVVGGVLLAITSWRWIFVVTTIPIVLTLWLLTKLEQPERANTHAHVDGMGAVLGTFGLGGTAYALIEQPLYGWTDGHIWPPLAGGLALLILFVWHEARTKHAMLPLSLFQVRNFLIGNLATLAIYAGLSVSSFLITITLQQIGGYSAFKASLATIPISIIMFFLSGRFGKLAGTYGPRLFMTLGPLVVAAGFVLMLRLQPDVHYMTVLIPGILLFGLGLSMTVAPLTSAVLGNIDASRAGVASAVNNAVARVAGLIAIALIGIVTGPHLNINGFRRALVWVAALMAIGAGISLAGIRNHRVSSQT